MSQSPIQNQWPPFDPSAPHQQRPKLRPTRGFLAKNGDQTVLGLSDARQISEKVVFTIPQAQVLLQFFDGSNTLDDVVNKVGRGLTRQMLEGLVAQLDDAGLLEGPTFDAMLRKMREDFDSSPTLPPSTTAQFADMLVMQHKKDQNVSEQEKAELGPVLLRQAMDAWMKQALEPAKDPSFDGLPRAIIVPHMDYWRGWLNYATVYGRMRVVDRPDRVVILGTNHYGQGTGVVGCGKGFESPLGVCEHDDEFAALVDRRLSPEQRSAYMANRYDHEREHSIELQIPWIQHIFGEDEIGKHPPVYAALVHDPLVNNGESYDGTGLGLAPFVDAIREAIAEAPGRTLLVASADLSHMGQSFGDQQPFAGEEPGPTAFRKSVMDHDQAMLALIKEGKVDELLATMAWQQNHTRWCSLGNLTAAMRITGATEVRVLNYLATGDMQNQAFVTCMAGAIL